MDSDDVERFVRACHLFADSVACFNETMAMTAENADRVGKGLSVAYDEQTILSLTDKHRLGTNDLIKRLNT